MSDMSKKPRPGFAPVYAAIYPKLCQVIQRHGYAAAVHGTMTRDFDLVCIPWTADCSKPQDVVDEIVMTFGMRHVRSPSLCMNHGRRVYELQMSFGECLVDLSFMPRIPA